MKKAAKYIILLLSVLLSALLIIFSKDIKDEIVKSVTICTKSIIVGLFPFMCLTLFIIKSGAVALFKQKPARLFIFSLSMISGYPIGAKILNLMYQNKQITKEQGSRLIPCLICAGPAFIVNIVGVGIFSSTDIGIRLYISQVIANLILFALNGGFKMQINRFSCSVKIIPAFTDSIKLSADAVMNICSYIILFSAFSSLFSLIFGNGITKIILCVFEVTGAIYNSGNLYLTCAVLGWSGVCVMLQVISAAGDLKVKILPLIVSRFFASVISCIVLKISFIICSSSEAVISNLNSTPAPLITDNTAFFVFFIFSAFVYMVSLFNKSSGKILKDITDQ